MEKEIGKLKKNEETDILIRIDDFGGKTGLTIREFVHSQNYTGFTKAGVRIKAEDFKLFKEMINFINESDLKNPEPTNQIKQEPKELDTDDAGIDENGLM